MGGKIGYLSSSLPQTQVLAFLHLMGQEQESNVGIRHLEEGTRQFSFGCFICKSKWIFMIWHIDKEGKKKAVKWSQAISRRGLERDLMETETTRRKEPEMWESHFPAHKDGVNLQKRFQIAHLAGLDHLHKRHSSSIHFSQGHIWYLECKSYRSGHVIYLAHHCTSSANKQPWYY